MQQGQEDLFFLFLAKIIFLSPNLVDPNIFVETISIIPLKTQNAQKIKIPVLIT
jgi:hypothetical protein